MKEYDLSSLLEMLGNDENALKDILGAFLSDFPEQMEKLMNGIKNNDFDSIAKSAHAIKGVVGNFNLTECYELAKEIEICAKTAEIAIIGEKTDKLNDDLKNFREWIKEKYSI